MNLDGEDVGAGDEETARAGDIRSVQKVLDGGNGRERPAGDERWRRRQVWAAKNLCPVEVNDPGVVAQKLECQDGVGRRTAEGEGSAEIGRDVSVVRVRSKAHEGGLVASGVGI